MRAGRCGMVVGAVLGSAAVGMAQTSATVPPNYHGPELSGRCAYLANNTIFYSPVVTISGYFRFDAERSFRQFAMGQMQGGVPRVSCRWLTKEQMKSTADLDVHGAGTGAQQVRTQQVNWHYVPGSGAAGNPAAGNGAVNGRANGSARTGVPSNGTGAGQAGQASAKSSNGQGGYGAGQAANGSGNGQGSNTGSLGQTVSDTKGQIGQQAASTMSDAASSAMGAVSGWLHRPHGGGNGSGQNTANGGGSGTAQGGSAAQGAAPAANGQGASAEEMALFGPSPNTAAAATGAPVTGPAAGVSGSAPGAHGSPFVFCHLKAGGSEYYSDVFPATGDTDDGTTRAFWKQVAHQYKIESIPYRDNAACTRAESEQAALAARQSLMNSAPSRGFSKEKVVDTAWTYAGEEK